MIGKKVLSHVYWHCSLTTSQSAQVQQHIAEAETLAGLRANTDYSVIKYDIDGQALSLLWYPDFFDEPFPSLEKSYRINLKTKRVEKRSYEASLNPPILHRKELLLSKDPPYFRIPRTHHYRRTAWPI
jgi:hypothetical protein